MLALSALFVLFDVAAWTAGRLVAASKARARHLAETRAAMAVEAVNNERLRIARELHDIVAHAVTVMVLQASGANRMVNVDPGSAREAMQFVEVVGRQATAELRRLLEAVRGALRAGASGFVLKDAEPEELIAAIRAVADGEAWLDPAVATKLLAEFKGRPETSLTTPLQLARLTPRELEVLVLIAHGLSNTAVANHLFIAEPPSKRTSTGCL